MQLKHAPGSQREYSNFALMVLSYALAKHSGSDFATLLRERLLSPLGMDDTYIVRCPPSVRAAQGHFSNGRSPALAACAQPCPTWCVISKVSSACAIARSRQSWRELRSSFPVLTVKQQAWPGRLGLPRTGADSSCIRAGPAASLPSQRGSREALSWLSCAAACVHAQSSVRCRASTIPCGFGTSGADFLPVQNGPETVGLTEAMLSQRLACVLAVS